MDTTQKRRVIYLDDATWAELKRRADGITVSEYVRRAIAAYRKAGKAA